MKLLKVQNSKDNLWGAHFLPKKNRAIYTDLFTGLNLNFYEMIFNDFQICLPSV